MFVLLVVSCTACCPFFPICTDSETEHSLFPHFATGASGGRGVNRVKSASEGRFSGFGQDGRGGHSAMKGSFVDLMHTNGYMKPPPCLMAAPCTYPCVGPTAG